MPEHRQDHTTMHKNILNVSKLTATLTCNTIIFGPVQPEMEQLKQSWIVELASFFKEAHRVRETKTMNATTKIPRKQKLK